MTAKTYNSDSARELARKHHLTLKDIQTTNGSNYVTVKNVKDTIEFNKKQLQKIKKENINCLIVDNLDINKIINKFKNTSLIVIS